MANSLDILYDVVEVWAVGSVVLGIEGFEKVRIIDKAKFMKI